MSSIPKLLTKNIPLLILPFLLQAQVGLKRTKISDDISMEIPVDFVVMMEGERMNKYVSDREPIAVYTSSDRMVDLGINQNSTQWGNGDLSILKDFYKAGILNLFTSVEFKQDEIRTIGGREYIVFEFISKITDEESSFGDVRSTSKYNYIQYTLRNGKVVLFNLSCPSRMESQWNTTAKAMMESIRLK